jgi:transformation/transcription domain-associated protein
VLTCSGFASGQALISSAESVPFRLTPNMQHFITRVGIEGVVTAAVTAIARSLTQPEFDLGPTLQLFVRDEVNCLAAKFTRGSRLQFTAFDVDQHIHEGAAS